MTDANAPLLPAPTAPSLALLSDGAVPTWRYAGFWWRLLAWIIDNLTITAAVNGLMMLTDFNERLSADSQRLATFLKELKAKNSDAHQHLNSEQAHQLKQKMLDIFLGDTTLVWLVFGMCFGAFVLSVFYKAALESSPLQATLGKKACGLIVTDRNGQRLGFPRAFVRSLLIYGFGPLSLLAYGLYFSSYGVNTTALFSLAFVGFVVAKFLLFNLPFFLAGWTPRKQSLQDLLVGTLVWRALPQAEAAPPPCVAIPAEAATDGPPTIRYAGFWWRFAALVIDQLLLIFGVIAGLIIAKMTLFVSRPDYDAQFLRAFLHDHALAINVVSFFLLWIYNAVLESSPWRATVGKKICGLVVADLEGRRLTFARASARHFAKFVTNMTLCVGYIMSGFTRRKQALHDKMTDTLVLRCD